MKILKKKNDMAYDTNGKIKGNSWENLSETTLTPSPPYQDITIRNLTVTGTSTGGDSIWVPDSIDSELAVLQPPYKKVKVDETTSSLVSANQMQVSTTASGTNTIDFIPPTDNSGEHAFLNYNSLLETTPTPKLNYAGALYSCDLDSTSKTNTFLYSNPNGLVCSTNTSTDDKPPIEPADVIFSLHNDEFRVHQKLTSQGETDLGTSGVGRWGAVYATTGAFSGDCNIDGNFNGTRLTVNEEVACTILKHILGGALSCQSSLVPNSPTLTLGTTANRWGNVWGVDGDFSGDVACSDLSMSGTLDNTSSPSIPKVIQTYDQSISTSSLTHTYEAKGINNADGARLLFYADGDGVADGSQANAYMSVTASNGAVTPVNRICASFLFDSFNPGNTNGSISLGTTSNRWSEAWVTSGVFNASDENLKKDIVDCPIGLKFIMKLKPKSYRWKNEKYNKGNKKSYGLLAQDVKKVMDEESRDDFDGYREDFIPRKLVPPTKEGGKLRFTQESTSYSLNYSAFIPALICGIKEQQQTILEQGEQIKELYQLVGKLSKGKAIKLS